MGALGTAVIGAPAGAGLSDFFVAGSGGRVYSVDGSTLEASEVYRVNGSWNVYDILYAGNDNMLVQIRDEIRLVDMMTGAESVFFDAADYEGTNENFYLQGFAATSDNELFMSMQQFTSNSIDLVGTTYHPGTGVYREMAVIEHPNFLGNYIDHVEIAPDVFLGVDRIGSQVHVINIEDGNLIDVYDLTFSPVSFLQLDEQLFLLDRDGGLYNFDAADGSTSLYGSLSGFSADLLGATSYEVFSVPAPGGTALLGFAGLLGVRRRR
ncbi:MAG: hypothetical protein ACF8K1_09180 [Phycisphaerales bacterium JB047]